MAIGHPAGDGPAPVSHPMSYEQEAIWLDDALGEGVSRYVESWTHRLHGAVDVSAVEAALTGIVRRHESLRSRLRLVDGQPRQEVLPPLPVPLVRRRVTPGGLDAAVREAVSGPLPLDEPPLLRATLIEPGDGAAVLAVALHHAVVDGWSLHLLDEEFSALYRQARGEPGPALPGLPLHLGPYARAQREREPGADTVAHWRETLAGIPLESTFPLDRPRPELLGHRGAVTGFTVDRELATRLRRLCHQLRATPFVVCAAALTALIGRHGEQRDIVLGAPVSRRAGLATESMVACLAEALPLRLRLEPERSFRELVARTRATVRAVTAHSQMPYTRLVALAGVRPSRARMSLFQVVLTVDDGQAPGLSLPGVRAERLYPHNGTAKFDVFVHLVPENGTYRGRLEYAADLFTPATGRRLAERFLALLTDAVARPDTAVAELTALTAEDRARVTGTWAHGPAATPGAPLAHEAFARAAARTPDAPAAVHGSERLTYAELDAAAGAVAARLVADGHGRGRIGVLLERSLDLPVAVLAVLKAGGCCVPLDPSYPAERLHFMLDDSRVEVVLTDRGPLHDRLAGRAGVRPLPLDEARAGAPAAARGDRALGELPRDIHRDDPAYMVYTSGSTGRPKGVVLPHRTLAAVVDQQVRRSSATGSGTGRTAQLAPMSFDVAFQELFATWAAGGTLVLVDEAVRRDPAALLALVENAAIERIFLPCVALQQLAEYAASTGGRPCPALREVISAGEQLFLTPAVRRFFTVNTAAVLDNQYGPSETHVVTAGRLTGPPEHWPDRADIGRPLPGARILILDEQLSPVPPGAVGEICIGGESVALGYHERPELTRRKFVRDPFTSRPATLYRSGDRGSFRPDGTIVFHGRRDGQVKVRGHRVELGEIESAVKAVPGVADAVVTADVSAARTTRLVAHYVPAGRDAPDAEGLRGALRQSLPDALVPSLLLPLPRLPLTPSGKVDRAALSAPGRVPDGREAPGTATAPPATEPERRMAAIWREVLGVERIGVDDDFFSVGGDSLLVVRLLLRVHEEWGVRLGLASFFAAPTVRRMAALLAGTAHRPALPDLSGDIELPPGIVPASGARRTPPASPERVLLTGGTGFLGTFLLAEVLRTTDATVHCLVRACDAPTGAKRLRAALDGYGLWHDDFTDRIAAVPGDLTRQRLGLTADTFDRLARRVDAVYHAGAAVNLAHSYEQLRAANVHGTAEVLRLAALHRTVPLHHISTVGVHSGRAPGGGPVPPTEPLPPAASLRNGYAQSKWAAETLLERARERGLPVSVYRPSRIWGASDTGLCQTSDYLWLLLKGCVEAGRAPEDLVEGFDLVPVDYVSAAVVALSRDPRAANRTFHLASGHRLSLARTVGWLRSLGYAIEGVPLGEWRRAVESDAANTAFPLLPLLPAGAAGGGTPHGDGVAFDATSTREALRGSGVVPPRMDRELFAAQVASFIRLGFLPPPAR
ncbi:non-ribosomal peptide synthetase [Streptomyces sp. NPDC001889]